MKRPPLYIALAVGTLYMASCDTVEPIPAAVAGGSLAQQVSSALVDNTDGDISRLERLTVPYSRQSSSHSTYAVVLGDGLFTDPIVDVHVREVHSLRREDGRINGFLHGFEVEFPSVPDGVDPQDYAERMAKAIVKASKKERACKRAYEKHGTGADCMQ